MVAKLISKKRINFAAICVLSFFSFSAVPAGGSAVSADGVSGGGASPENAKSDLWAKSKEQTRPNTIIRPFTPTPGNVTVIAGGSSFSAPAGGSTGYAASGVSGTSIGGGITTNKAMVSGIATTGTWNFAPSGGFVTTGSTAQSQKDTSELEFVSNPWFGLVSGLASVLGLLVALYPVPASNLPPSEYKTLLWRKSLYISLGVGMIVFSTIQLYQQPDPPDGLFGFFYNILHGITFTNTEYYSGTWVWGILLVIGVTIFFYGASGRAQEQIRERVIAEFAAIRRGEEDATKKLFGKRELADLSDEEQMTHQEMKGFYRLLRYSTIEMLTGSQFTRSMKYNDAAIFGGRLEDALAVLETASKLVQPTKKI